MSNVSLFFKKNKVIKENTFYAPTKSLCDEKGEPLKWEIKPLSTKENTRLQDASTIEIPVTGKPNMFRQKVDGNKYVDKMLAASVVFPDLLNAELQDSYDVKTPEELLKEMVDNPGEYSEFMQFVQKFNGFNVSLQEEVDEAKN